MNDNRSSPVFWQICWMHFLSLKQYIVNFSKNHIKPWNKMLDFGCWNSPYRDLYMKKNINYIGIDIGDSPEFNPWYIVYPGGKTSFTNNEFDIIVSTQVFEHLNDPKFYASELERITKKWGYILITVAHLREHHPYPYHYQNLTIDSIQELFTHSEIIDIKGDTSEFQNVAMLSAKAISKINKYLGGAIWLCNNIFFWILDKLKLHKIWPQPYNTMTGNLMFIMKKK